MKKNELVIVKGLNIKELREKARTLKKEISEVVMDKNMKKLKDLKTSFKKRKDLAQVLTVLRQKTILAELEPKVEKIKESSVISHQKEEKQEKTEEKKPTRKRRKSDS